MEFKTISLKDYKCQHCDKTVRRWNLKVVKFMKDYFTIGNSTIWKKRKCWLCKKSPVIGDSWSISYGGTHEKNRLFCSECSPVIQSKLNELDS